LCLKYIKEHFAVSAIFFTPYQPPSHPKQWIVVAPTGIPRVAANQLLSVFRETELLRHEFRLSATYNTFDLKKNSY
jgi:hypothetical protein